MKVPSEIAYQKSRKKRIFLLKLICLSSSAILILLPAFNRKTSCGGLDKNYGTLHLLETYTCEGATYLKPITSLVGFNRKFMKRKAGI